MHTLVLHKDLRQPWIRAQILDFVPAQRKLWITIVPTIISIYLISLKTIVIYNFYNFGQNYGIWGKYNDYVNVT